MFTFAIKGSAIVRSIALAADAAPSSPPATAVLMMAVMDKVGTFGMLRYCLQRFLTRQRISIPLIVALAIASR